MKRVRLKYWRGLLKNKKFVGKLPMKLREEYHSRVEKMADYEFSMFNIQKIYLEMCARMSQGIDQMILELFDQLTVEHSWYPESKKNIHYYNGWKTNKAHMVCDKCILPINLFARDTHYNGALKKYETWTFDQTKAYRTISDLEKTLDYLSAQPIEDYNLEARLNNCVLPGGRVSNVPLKYFKLDAYKKGTIHIKFNPDAMDIVRRLNIFAARNRGWLPPNYGKTSYSGMTDEEKAVVDSFHGDGTDGSGESEYAAVMARRDYFLAEPAQKVLLLDAPD